MPLLEVLSDLWEGRYMDRLKLIQRVRILTRDLTGSIFREHDIVDFINEGINRFVQVIPELKDLEELNNNTDVPSLIPKQYQHLLAVYATSRCFGQDERHYQASNLMNEFEVKLDELKMNIENGTIAILDGDGNVVENDIPIDYVDLKPYWGSGAVVDFDEGVEGVE